MQSPLVVDALREQLLQIIDWYHHGMRRFEWGAVIHRRNERGKLRFGAITPQGESLLLSEPLLCAPALTSWSPLATVGSTVPGKPFDAARLRTLNVQSICVATLLCTQPLGKMLFEGLAAA